VTPEIVQRRNVPFGQIDDMDVITHAGTIGRLVVVTPDIEKLPPPDREASKTSSLSLFTPKTIARSMPMAASVCDGITWRNVSARLTTS
jgi:hypothetical protein